VPTRVELGNGGPKKRLIYVFEDLPLPPTTRTGSVGEPIASTLVSSATDASGVRGQEPA
jgi:hypothetical protein